RCGDHRRRYRISVLWLRLSRVRVPLWIRIRAELRLRSVCLCSGIRIFGWLLRSPPLLRASLLPLLEHVTIRAAGSPERPAPAAGEAPRLPQSFAFLALGIRFWNDPADVVSICS